ncbi:hypothetical protein GCM10028796_33050 [Ramlibacter monticola]
MADRVAESALFAGWPVRVIPNALDANVYKPVDSALAREIAGIPNDDWVILYCALGGGSDPNKGFDLLSEALHQLVQKHPSRKIRLICVGQSEPQQAGGFPCPVEWMGHLSDDIAMALVYSAADVVVVPSRQESFSQTAAEAQACGVPVVAFRIGGLKDVISHAESGYLAEPFDATDFAHGLGWVLGDPTRRRTLGMSARRRAIEKFSYPVVAALHADLYEQVIASADHGLQRQYGAS